MANTGNQKQKLLCLMRMLQEETDPSQGLSMPQIIERLGGKGASALVVAHDGAVCGVIGVADMLRPSQGQARRSFARALGLAP